MGSRLKETDKRALSNYIYQLKLKRKKQEENEKKRSELGAQMSEKGINILGQKTYELQQALLMPMEENERWSLIKDSIEKNLYLFLEYMEGYPTPFNDFLKIVVSL